MSQHTRHSTSADVGTLEPRVLLASVVLSNNILTIRGDNGVNNVIVVREGPGSKVLVSVNGAAEEGFNDSDVNAVVAFGGDGNDLLAVSQRQRTFTKRTTFVGGPGNDTLVGGDGRAELVAGPGDDLLEGGAADNTLVGGSGRDTLMGGQDFDLIIAGRGHAYIDAGRGQNIVFGGERGDTIVGGDFRDEIFGGPGADRIVLGSGDDTVWGGGGDDTIIAGSGPEQIHREAFSSVTKIREELFPAIPT